MVAVVDGDGPVAVVTIGPAPPDLATVDAFARLHLLARRAGWSLRVLNQTAELREVLELAGLRLEPRREAEGGEELRIDEVVDRDDPVA